MLQVMLASNAARIRSALAVLSLGAAMPLGAQLATTPQGVVPSAEAQQVLDSAVVLARRFALRRDSVDWDALIPRLQRQLGGARTYEEAYPALGLLVRSLGDRHSHVRVPPPDAPSSEPGGSSSAPATPPRIFREPPIDTRWLAGARVSYVHIPAHDGSDVGMSRAMAYATREQLVAQRDSGACGYVVDVRGNTGGNMWPMLASLRPLLGEGPLGSFHAPDEEQQWGARAEWDHDDRYVSGYPAWPDLSSAPVAVLTNALTASSGEAIVTAFRGRPASRSFGAPTAGLSTVNNGYPLPGGAMLLLTTAVLEDRTGVVYGGPIEPDENVPDTHTEDAPLRAALSWLARQPACAAPATTGAAGNR